MFLTDPNVEPSPGLITAAFKLKRKALENKYQDDIAEMYSGNNNVTGPKKMVNNNSQPRVAQ
jgi:long-subunit acyl-CoA synthetase (AMP-forming)